MDMKRPLVLFTTYFISLDDDRQYELNHCLLQNLKNPYFERVIIFIQTEEERKKIEAVTSESECKHMQLVFLNRIPSYQDWLKYSVDICPNSDVIFANADIYFDESIQGLNKYLKDCRGIVCLSRHDQDEKGLLKTHPNPHWSQDAWAIRAENIQKIEFLEDLSFATGKPRCDNRFAFNFSVWGWNIYNPCHDVKAIHLHTSKIRNYQYQDLVNVGAMAYVYPSSNPDQPSFVDYSIFILKSSSIRKVAINDFLERKRKVGS